MLWDHLRQFCVKSTVKNKMQQLNFTPFPFDIMCDKMPGHEILQYHQC